MTERYLIEIGHTLRIRYLEAFKDVDLVVLDDAFITSTNPSIHEGRRIPFGN